MSNLLVRTPKPRSLESFRGYLLRLAETNGLSSPTPILKLAGVKTVNLRYVEHPVEVLSKVTGHDLSLFLHLPLTHPISKIQQVSGHAVSKGYSILSRSKICPCCIKEQGFAPAYWDLIAVEGCYKHQQTLISKCPQCNLNLSYDRPGLLTCNCGADLTSLNGNPISQEELEFLKIIHAKFNDITLDDAESKVGLPLRHLTEISLSTILAIMHTMGSMHLFVDNKVVRAKACTHKDEIKYALEILKDWPNNFFKFLHRVGEQHGRKSLGLDGQFSFFTQRFFKRGYPYQEIRFLKEAFITFGQQHWGNAFYYPRMQTKTQSSQFSNFVGVYEFAERMGHSPSAVKTMIREGRLVVKELAGAKIDKAIIDLEKSNIKLPENKNTLGLRDAAKFIGIPTSVLIGLRELGLYQSEHLLLRKKSFCIEDLQTLKQKILDCQEPKIPNEQLISIAYIMRRSFRTGSLKTTIIEKLLNGTLACFGCEKEVSEIRVRLTDLEALTERIFSENRDWLTIKQTSLALHCDNGIISKMLNDGLLDGTEEKGVHQIKVSSVHSFKRRYVSLKQLTTSFNVSVKTLNDLCQKNALTLLSVKRKFNVSQNFIARTETKTLANLVHDYLLNHKKLAYRCRLDTANLNWIE